jgi:ribosome biogenesis GTPase
MLENTVFVQLGIPGCFGDQPRQRGVVQVPDAAPRRRRKAPRFYRHQMANKRRRRNICVKRDRQGPLILVAGSDAGGFPSSLQRVAHGRACSRVVQPKHQLGESIQGERYLPRNGYEVMRSAFPARVVRVGRNSAWVVREDETTARLASLRRKGASMQTMLAPGDLVDVRPLEDGSVLVDRVHPRTFTLQRRTRGGRTKTMAANVDTLAIVAATVNPPLRLSMIDQLIAFAELQELRVLLALTKIDLAGAAETQAIARLYRGLGYPTIPMQPKQCEGVADFRAALGHARALLVGQSGVGKSSIFRALGGATEVGEVSRFGRGRQTTTAARLLRLGDGFLIDSPGVGAFELGEVSSAELAAAFVEFGPLVPDCRFRDCAHLTEPGCAVRSAAEAGRIASSRYESYRLILARADPLSGYA